MADWELFEENACYYLNQLYKNSSISFHGAGGKDAYSSDIQVLEGNSYIFSIEAKYAPSQSGQFVLLEHDNTYSLSPASKFAQNQLTEEIIDFLNENKLDYSPEGQRAIQIEINQDVLTDWIIEHYKQKDSYLIITSTKLNDYKAIVPTEEIGKYFIVSAVIRRKRSGTSYVAKSRMESCIDALKAYTMERQLEIAEISQSKKPFVLFNEPVHLAKSERYFGDDFFLSPNNTNGGYYLKKRSKTNNLNVIFSLDYIGPEENIGVDLLDEMVRNKSLTGK